MNPMLQILNRVNKNSDLIGLVSSIKNGDAERIANQLLGSNPQFREFLEANKGKTPEQVASENGIDFNQVRDLLR